MELSLLTRVLSVSKFDTYVFYIYLEC
jgi:hypothetical protein